MSLRARRALRKKLGRSLERLTKKPRLSKQFYKSAKRSLLPNILLTLSSYRLKLTRTMRYYAMYFTTVLKRTLRIV
jgi:hypothetical protein